MLLAVGALHGNEPEGVEALRAVHAELHGVVGALRGDVVMLAGNLRALAEGKRYLTRDLNRDWSAARLDSVRRAGFGAELGPEDSEQRELDAALDAALGVARGRVYVADLHSTSAEGFPFSTTTSDRDDCAFARLLPLPLVLGLLEAVAGRTLVLHLKERGCTVLALEGGPNTSHRSTKHLIAALWLLLEGTGIVDAGSVHDFESYRDRLDGARGSLPCVIQVHHRHGVNLDDGFRMEPRFANLQRITQGQLLARDRRGDIRASEDGYLVLPGYQPQGDDGFFLGAERDVESV